MRLTLRTHITPREWEWRVRPMRGACSVAIDWSLGPVFGLLFFAWSN